MRPHPLLLSILAVLPGCGETFVTNGCVAVPEDTKTCPAADSVSLDDVFLTEECDVEILEVQGKGELRASAGLGPNGPVCCYPVEVHDDDPNAQCVIGRPYVEHDAAKLAHVDVHRRASDAVESQQNLRARAWALAGAAEHASVAAFNRLSLQLLALGAPIDLVGDVQLAALQEVQHARSCFDLAKALGANGLSLGKFPFAAAVDPNVDLAELAYAAVREGCLAETLGATVVASVADEVADEQMKHVLQQLAREESEHAVLSFRIVAWALRSGGQHVRDAVTKALAEPWPKLDTAELAVRTGVALSVIERATADAYRRVLVPANRALSASC